MNDQKPITLDEAVNAARQLRPEAQEMLARELMERLTDFDTPARPFERQAIIKERLAKPLTSISRDDLMAMLRKYDPDL